MGYSDYYGRKQSKFYLLSKSQLLSSWIKWCLNGDGFDRCWIIDCRLVRQANIGHIPSRGYFSSIIFMMHIRHRLFILLFCYFTSWQSNCRVSVSWSSIQVNIWWCFCHIWLHTSHWCRVGNACSPRCQYLASKAMLPYLWTLFCF